MRGQSLSFLCRAPGSPEKTVDVGSDFRARVIETKERIESPAFEFPLAHHTTAAALIGLMRAVWEKSHHIPWIMRVLI